ncbi:uncharacterized protein LOC143362250 [Halictus rubicundus]|uniref:uncharacterized protein LOC143362250 n=1 Tax=Halictus rubicundus TaxID=77578 RepID=UPI004035165F
MIQCSGDANKSAASSSKKPANLSEDMENDEVKELRERIAVRFLIKKSKRFDFSKAPVQGKLQISKVAPPKKQPLECLFYLGLAPKNSNTSDRKMPKQENETDNIQFRKPTVYECSYCMKFFLHKIPHRRHMIGHIKEVHVCTWCNRAFSSIIMKRRHEFWTLIDLVSSPSQRDAKEENCITGLCTKLREMYENLLYELVYFFFPCTTPSFSRSFIRVKRWYQYGGRQRDVTHF